MRKKRKGRRKERGKEGKRTEGNSRGMGISVLLAYSLGILALRTVCVLSASCLRPLLCVQPFVATYIAFSFSPLLHQQIVIVFVSANFSHDALILPYQERPSNSTDDTSGLESLQSKFAYAMQAPVPSLLVFGWALASIRKY